VYRGSKHTIVFVPKVRVEVPADDGDAARVVGRWQGVDDPCGYRGTHPHR
jgi:hypothetical protein